MLRKEQDIKTSMIRYIFMESLREKAWKTTQNSLIITTLHAVVRQARCNYAAQQREQQRKIEIKKPIKATLHHIFGVDFSVFNYTI